MPESSIEIKHMSCRYRMSPLRQSVHSLPMPRNPYTMPSTFCTEDNVAECISYINQEVSSLGFPSVCTESAGNSELNLVAVLNSMYDLIQLHRRGLRAVEDMEMDQVKTSSHIHLLQLSNARLKDQLELSRRENTGLLERERQLQLRVKSLQNSLKNEKEELQRLQNVTASRATQYNHDMKRKEREFSKLKERLNQLLIDRKDKKQAIEVLNYVGRSNGKRGLWKTDKTEARQEGEMYKTLLNNYDSRQKGLVMENAELKKVLHQMKREMVSILSPRQHGVRGETQEEGLEQAVSEEEEVCDSSRERRECEQAREQLTKSIRLQWRRLKSHMERLDSQASLVQTGDRGNMEAMPTEPHEEEMDRLKLEIQQCKDFIHTQQQLLQQLSSPCDEETASLLNDCYMLEEKERLKEEWKTFEEQRTNFETERRNFTEAAIRLGHERKAFEEDRATWIKHQFLNLTPFPDQTRPQMSQSQSALSACAETEKTEVRTRSTSAKLNKSPSAFSKPRDAPMKTPSTADLYPTLHLIPENSPSTSQPRRESWQESEPGTLRKSNVTIQNGHLNGGKDCRVYAFTEEKTGSI